MAKPHYQEAVVCFDKVLDALQCLPESRDTCEQDIDIQFDLRNALQGEYNQVVLIPYPARGCTTDNVIDSALGFSNRH